MTTKQETALAIRGMVEKRIENSSAASSKRRGMTRSNTRPSC